MLNLLSIGNHSIFTQLYSTSLFFLNFATEIHFRRTFILPLLVVVRRKKLVFSMFVQFAFLASGRKWNANNEINRNNQLKLYNFQVLFLFLLPLLLFCFLLGLVGYFQLSYTHPCIFLPYHHSW